VIGQAKGMLMERYNIDATAVFDLRVKLSPRHQHPLNEVARTLIELDHPPNTRHTT
jgi:AmiR/NasT family two-component response regulator